MDKAAIITYILSGAICASVAATSLFIYTPIGKIGRRSRTSIILFFSYFPVTAVGFVMLSLTQLWTLPVHFMQSIYYAVISLAGWLLYSGLCWRRGNEFSLISSPLFLGNALLWFVVALIHMPALSLPFSFDFLHIVTLGTLNILSLTAMSFYVLRDREITNVGEKLFITNLSLRLTMSIGIYALYNITNDITLFYANIAITSIITTVLTIGAVYCMFLFDRIDKHKLDAETDFLTGILNRRAFMQKMQNTGNDLYLKSNPGAIVMCDIDNFKRLNDTYGHDVGDLAIQKIASIMTKSLRDNDLCARMGGEEFSLFISDADDGLVYKIVDRIRSNVEKSELIVGEQMIQFTASFGFVMLDREKSLSALLKDADDAMYEAKKTGRNRVCNFNNNDIVSEVIEV